MTRERIVEEPTDMASPAPMRLSPLSHTQRVYRELRRMIIEGDIAPGSKLKIGELRLRLDAGGTPVREALSLLTSDQLVERIDQRGFRAAPVSRAHFQEILELRCQLESLALRTCIASGSAAWKSALEFSLAELSAVDRSCSERWETLHKGFHRALICDCNSPILLRFCAQLYDLNIRYRNLAARPTRLGRRDVDAEHRALVDTALAGEPDVACAALRDHYVRTGDYLTEQLAELV